MATPRIDIDEAPDPALREAILKPLRAYNESRAGAFNPELLAITLRDPENNEITGGLWGTSVRGWLYVDLLVVPDTFRGQGIGTELLTRVEARCCEKAGIGLFLSTGSFQAPGFYEKLGFTAFGRIADYPLGHTTTYYQKRLDP